MPRLHLLALCTAGLVGACNGRRATERLALDTSFTPIPVAPAAGVASSRLPSAAGRGKSARVPPVAANGDGEVDPGLAKTFLVWARKAHGPATTYHLDASGEELERLGGVYIGTRAGSWQWREEEIAVPTRACEHYEEDGSLVRNDPPPPGRATVVTLVLSPTGAREQQVVEPLASGAAANDGELQPGMEANGSAVTAEDHGRIDEDADLAQGAEDVHHTVLLAGSVGPYLFVEESTYAYTCGAHGNTSVSARIWNAVSGRGESMPSDFGSMEGPVGRAAQELTEDDDPFPANDENLELTALVPRYGPKGTLRLGLQLTAPTCYACTRGGYGSYTKSTVVDAAALPKLFARYASPPHAVRAWAASHPDERLGGWSGLDF